MRMDKLIFYIITYMNAVNNTKKLHVDGAQAKKDIQALIQ